MNGTNLVTELKSGNVQLAASGGIGSVPVKDLDVLKKDSKLIVKAVPSLNTQYLEVNNSNPAFNVKFRRAVTMAIDRQKSVMNCTRAQPRLYQLFTQKSALYMMKA